MSCGANKASQRLLILRKRISYEPPHFPTTRCVTVYVCSNKTVVGEVVYFAHAAHSIDLSNVYTISEKSPIEAAKFAHTLRFYAI